MRCVAELLIWYIPKLMNICTAGQYVRSSIPLKFKAQHYENNHYDCLTHMVWDHGFFKCWNILIYYAKINIINIMLPYKRQSQLYLIFSYIQCSSVNLNGDLKVLFHSCNFLMTNFHFQCKDLSSRF